jgi:hypothetical protein
MRLVIYLVLMFYLSGLLAEPTKSNGEEKPFESELGNRFDKELRDNFNECLIGSDEGSGWIDNIHGYLNTQFCTPAVWFDSFFSNERIDEEVRLGSNISWQNDYIEDEFGLSQYSTKVRGSFKLPKAYKSLRLVFEGTPEDSSEDIVPSDVEESKSQIGFFYELTRSPRAKLSLKIRLSPSITLRHSYNLPVTSHFTAQFTQQLFHQNSNFGVSSQLDLIESFSKDLILRQSNVISRNGDTEIWGTSLVFFQRLSKISALSYESSYNGVTEPETIATNTRLGIRYRRQFHRKWLFYEVAPEITWPRDIVTNETKETKALFFRLEVNFVNR